MTDQNDKLLTLLDELGITYEVHEHPPAPTVADALEYWKDIDATHCKNLFFRNHKGDKHYLVILEHTMNLAIKDLEKSLGQGKLSLTSDWRREKYLGVEAGSITPFGLINDEHHEVMVFLDDNLKQADKISFHPNRNTATLVLSFSDFIRFLVWTGNHFEFRELYHL